MAMWIFGLRDSGLTQNFFRPSPPIYGTHSSTQPKKRSKNENNLDKELGRLTSLLLDFFLVTRVRLLKTGAETFENYRIIDPVRNSLLCSIWHTKSIISNCVSPKLQSSEPTEDISIFAFWSTAHMLAAELWRVEINKNS
jgi:hypothetical protein